MEEKIEKVSMSEKINESEVLKAIQVINNDEAVKEPHIKFYSVKTLLAGRLGSHKHAFFPA